MNYEHFRKEIAPLISMSLLLIILFIGLSRLFFVQKDQLVDNAIKFSTLSFTIGALLIASASFARNQEIFNSKYLHKSSINFIKAGALFIVLIAVQTDVQAFLDWKVILDLSSISAREIAGLSFYYIFAWANLNFSHGVARLLRIYNHEYNEWKVTKLKKELDKTR